LRRRLEYYEKNVKEMEKKIDVVSLLKLMNEFEVMKRILLNAEEVTLVERLARRIPE
jgi:hypothetical protein